MWPRATKRREVSAVSQTREGPADVGASIGAGITTLSTHPKFATAIVPLEARSFRARFELLAAIARDPKLGRAIFHHVNRETGRCFPSFTRIAQFARVTLRAVPRAVARLCARGHIVRIKNNRVRSNAYTWSMPTADVSDAHDTDKLTDIDDPVTDKRESRSLTAASAEPRDKSNLKNKVIAETRGTRLPDDWCPTEDLKARARTDFPQIDLEAVIREFRDHWHTEPDPRGRKLDWDTVFAMNARRLAQLYLERHPELQPRRAREELAKPKARQTEPGPVGKAEMKKIGSILGGIHNDHSPEKTDSESTPQSALREPSPDEVKVA